MTPPIPDKNSPISPPPAALYRDGLAAAERGDHDEAIRLLSRIDAVAGAIAVLAGYHLGRSYWAAGLAALRQGRYADAQDHLTKAARLNPNSADLADHLARSYAAVGRHDAAADAFDAAHRHDSTRPVRAVRAALAAWRAGRKSEALAALTQTAQDHPSDAEAHLQLGLMLGDANRPVEAMEHLRQAAALEPRHADAHRYLGLALAAAGQMEEAVDALFAAQRLRPQDAVLAMELGMALRATRLTPGELLARRRAADPAAPRDAARQRAIASLARAFAADPELVTAFLDLPGGAQENETLSLLADAVDQALAQHPNYADLHHGAARLAERLGRLEAAVEQDEAALALNPGYVQALIHVGRLYARLQRDDEAIARLERAVAFGGDHADVHFALGELHRRAGRRHRAESEFRRALDLNGNYAAAREALEAIAAA